MYYLLIMLLLAVPQSAPTAVDVRGTTRAGGKPVMDAVVWLEVQNPPPPPARKVVLDQRNLEFSPHVLAIQVGTTVDFPNNDRVFHNIFSFRDGKRFDLGLYPVGAVKRLKFDQPGLSRLFCNIHPHMAAYIMAVDTPYFAVSDRDGAFQLARVPPGTYTYRAWRPGGAIISGSVTVRAGATMDVQWP